VSGMHVCMYVLPNSGLHIQRAKTFAAKLLVLGCVSPNSSVAKIAFRNLVEVTQAGTSSELISTMIAVRDMRYTHVTGLDEALDDDAVLPDDPGNLDNYILTSRVVSGTEQNNSTCLFIPWMS
jgi:hypothetical protein